MDIATSRIHFDGVPSIGTEVKYDRSPLGLQRLDEDEKYVTLEVVRIAKTPVSDLDHPLVQTHAVNSEHIDSSTSDVYFSVELEDPEGETHWLECWKSNLEG